MLHEINNLLAPPSPVMVNVMSPVVYPDRDILLLEQGIHLTGTVEQFFLPGSLTYTHDDFPFGRCPLVQGVLFHDNLINKQPAAEAAWLRLNTDVAGSLAALPGKRLEIQNRLLARLILLVKYLGEVLAILTN